MARWLAIDHGTRRLGVALGDSADGLSMPLTMIPAGSDEQTLAAIRTVIAEYQPVGLVVGWPLNMDDTEGPQGKQARAFAAMLEDALDIDVRLWDERLSSFVADEALAGEFTRNKRRARQDAVAAAEILRDFLASDGPSAAMKPSDATPDSARGT
jgi:putative Holliday junction resolvase